MPNKKDEKNGKDEIFDSAEMRAVAVALKHRNAKFCKLLRESNAPTAVTNSLKYVRYILNLSEHMHNDNNSPRDIAYLMARDLAADYAVAFFAKKLLGVSLYPVLILDSAKYLGPHIEKAVEPIKNEVLSFSAPQNFAEQQYQRDLREAWLATAPLVMTGQAWSAVRSFFSDQFDRFHSILTHPNFLKTTPHPMRFSSLFFADTSAAEIDITKMLSYHNDSGEVTATASSPYYQQEPMAWHAREAMLRTNNIILIPDAESFIKHLQKFYDVLLPRFTNRCADNERELPHLKEKIIVKDQLRNTPDTILKIGTYYLYTITTDDEFTLHQENGPVFHSHVAAGKDVFCAGKLAIHHDTVTGEFAVAYNYRSGHFRPYGTHLKGYLEGKFSRYFPSQTDFINLDDANSDSIYGTNFKEFLTWHLDSSQTKKLPSALRDSIQWDERRHELPNVIIPWLTDRAPVPREYYLAPQPVAALDSWSSTHYAYFDPCFYFAAEKETAITNIDSEKSAHSETITEIKPINTTVVGSTNTSSPSHTETKKSNATAEITPIARVIPGAFEMGTRITFNNPIAPIVIVGIQVSDQLIADGLNALIFGSKHSGTLYRFGKKYTYKCEGCFYEYEMEITVAEINEKGDRCNRQHGKFKLKNLTYSDKKNIPRIQKAVNKYLSPLVGAHFKEDQTLFLQQINTALSQYDFPKATQLHDAFYKRYAGIYPGFENEKQAGTQQLLESEKTYRDYQAALKLQAELRLQEELKLQEAAKLQEELALREALKLQEEAKLQEEFRLKELAEQENKKALALSHLKEMHFRIQTTQLSVDAIFFLLKKADPRLEKYCETANAPLSAGLQLAAHHYSFGIAELKQTTTPLDYTRYIFLAAQLCRASASIFEWHQFPRVQKTLLFANNYALPVSQLILSTAFLLTGNVAAGVFLFSPELVLKIPEAREFLLMPNPQDQLAYARFIVGMMLTQLLHNKKMLLGVMTQATSYLGVYSNTMWEWIKRGLFSVLSKEIAEQLVNFTHPETISDVLNNGFYLLKATEILSAFYKTNQHAEKNWGRYCVEWQRAQRKSAIISLYDKHVISRNAEVGNTPMDDHSLLHAVSYYTEEDHQQLRSMITEVSIDALSKKLNRPIVIISQGHLNLKPLSNELYDLTGDPIFIILNDNHHYSAFLPRGESYFERDYAKKLAEQQAQLLNIDFHAVTASHENTIRSLDAIHTKTVACENQIAEIDRINHHSQQLINAIGARLTFFEKREIAPANKNMAQFLAEIK